MRWYQRLFRGARTEKQLDAELRFHLEQQIADYVATGMSPEEARRRARLEFGGLDQVKEECRDVGAARFVETLIQDVRYGLRQLRRNPGFTAVAIITLALGIGANTAIFGLIDAVMLRMLPVSRPGELRLVQNYDPHEGGEPDPTFTNPLWEALRDQQDVFSGVFAWGHGQFDLTHGGAVHNAAGIWVSGNFFNTLGLRPAAGRLIASSDDHRGCPAVAVLSYGFWQGHYGGSASALGSILSLSSHPFEVIGVAPPGFDGMEVGAKFDVAVPICTAAIFDGKGTRLDGRSWWWLRVVGRIKAGTSRARLAARLNVLSPRVFGAAVPQDWSADMQREYVKQVLTTVPAATGISFLRRQFEQPLRILMAVVALVLLIASANIASLMLARAAARQREIAVRQALGASRARLICQLLTECMLVSSAGAALGIIFARCGAALLVRFISTTENTVFLDVSLDCRTLGFTAAAAVLTAILFGLLPAVRSTRVSLSSAMKGSQAPETQYSMRFHARKWIVASQVALSLVLVVAAGLLLHSFAKLATLNIGFDRNGVLLVRTDLKAAKVAPALQLDTYQAVENRLRALPGVLSVSRSSVTPISGDAWNQWIRTDWSKALTGHNALAWFNCVSPGFFQTLRMELLAGRNFTNTDTKTAPAVAIVNQTLARRFFPGLDPIGKTFRIDDIAGRPGPPIEVVGIVNDAKYESVREQTLPTAFFPVLQVPGPGDTETFELRAAISPSALTAAAQAAVARVNKEIPLEFNTLAEQVDDSMVPEHLLALLSGFFGALALMLAMIGLYGTMSYLVTQRQTEFGIRMALGAQPGSILRLVMQDVIAILALGVAAGLCVSIATVGVLQKLLFGLSSSDPVTLIVSACVLSAAALLAGYLPARRATKVDPMVALRHE